MNSSFFLTVTVLALVGCCQSAPKVGKCPTPGAEDDIGFDVSKYLGRWYEIRRTDSPNEKGVKCSTANYSLRSDGKVNVTNSGVNSEGDDVVAYLTATIVDESKPNFLNVELFPGAPTASYWVIKTDYQTYSTVVSCVQITADMYSVSGWILSRTPTLSGEVVEELTKLLETKGVTELLTPDRAGCTN
ncbi:apolipoprotein D-like [Panonychus citri]|uniref:apolipoprotein D-like n=1 Tax=Panonychus citri TaxID=50023 RepID=UPI002306DE2E|nr:apolipoprotein D-like [Panonychus citri]